MFDKKLTRFIPYCDWHRNITKEVDDKGDCISVNELKSWLALHLRGGKISDLYSDLNMALGD